MFYTHTQEECKTLKKKVEFCLRLFPETRDSDITLTHKIWTTFFSQYVVKELDGFWVKLEYMYLLPREDNVKRWRAKIQNPSGNYPGKYPPTRLEVAVKRGWKEEIWRSNLGYNPELRQANLI